MDCAAYRRKRERRALANASASFVSAKDVYVCLYSHHQWNQHRGERRTADGIISLFDSYHPTSRRRLNCLRERNTPVNRSRWSDGEELYFSALSQWGPTGPLVYVLLFFCLWTSCRIQQYGPRPASVSETHFVTCSPNFRQIGPCGSIWNFRTLTKLRTRDAFQWCCVNYRLSAFLHFKIILCSEIIL